MKPLVIDCKKLKDSTEKLRESILDNSWFPSYLTQPTVLGTAIELEHAGHYQAACTQYLLFHMWLNKKVKDKDRRLVSHIEIKELFE